MNKLRGVKPVLPLCYPFRSIHYHKYFKVKPPISYVSKVCLLRSIQFLRYECNFVLSYPHKPRAYYKRPLVLAVSLQKNNVFTYYLHKFRRFLYLFCHFFRLSCLCSPLVVTGPLVYCGGRYIPSLSEIWWNYASWSAAYSSVVFIKFLQWASTRRDIFSSEFCNRFQHLHNKVPEHSWKMTESALVKSYGSEWKEKLFLDKVPIGSGCIAQVYRGKLLESGEEVAIKVVHPLIKEAVHLDLDLLQSIASILEKFSFFHWSSLRGCVDDFSSVMLKQMNMKQEANNLDRFRKNFMNHHSIRFPEPKHKYTTEDILIETFEYGKPISNYYKEEKSIRKEIAAIGVEAFLRMIFLHNFAHGDLHPGNILISKENSNPILTLIDAGIVTELTSIDKKNFVDLFLAIVKKDGYKAGKIMVERSPNQCKDPNAFCKDIDTILQDALKLGLQLGKIQIADIIQRLFKASHDHQVKLSPHYASIVISIAILEGVGRTLDEDLDLFKVAAKVLLKSQIREGF